VDTVIGEDGEVVDGMDVSTQLLARTVSLLMGWMCGHSYWIGRQGC